MRSYLVASLQVVTMLDDPLPSPPSFSPPPPTPLSSPPSPPGPTALALSLGMTNPTLCWQDAPYLLEPLAHSFASEDTVVKLALLSAAAKLFFQRPPECQALLGCALAAAVADTDQDVHDRGLMYYRCDAILPAPCLHK